MKRKLTQNHLRKPLENYLQCPENIRNATVLDCKGKKIIKSIDKETFELKFG